jgi:methyl-accepting chemotaxis protein
MLGPLRRLVPDFIRRSYVLKFGITLLIIGLVVGGVGILGTDLVRGEARDQVNEDLTTLAQQEASSFESWNGRNEVVANNLASSLQNVPGSQLPDFLRNQIDSANATPGGERLLVVDLDPAGSVIYGDSDGELDAQNLSDVSGDPFWATRLSELGSLSGTRAVGTVGDDETGTRLSVYATPIPDRDRVLVYFVDLTTYSSALRAEGGRVTYVVDATQGGGQSSTVVYDSTGRAFFESYGNLNVLDGIRRLKAGTHEDGTQVVTSGDATRFPPLATSTGDEAAGQYIPSYASVEGTPFGVVVHTPQSQALGFVNNVQQYGFIAALGAVLGVGIIGALVGRSTAASIDRLRRKSEEMERGNLDVDFETDRIDNIGQLYDGMESMRDALRNQIVEAREARQEAEQARERAEETSEHLQAKANEYRDAMQAVADGDLSRRLDPSERNEAMREIAVEFNSMIGEIETTVAQLKEFATEVASSSEEVTASAEEVRAASQNVTESIQQISDGADRQDEALQSVSGEMSGLSTTVEEIASLSNEVADISERTAETSQRGSEAAQAAVEGMNQIESESRRAVEQIERLDEEMDQIDELIEFVTDVANQTNRLALNANIEASRASSGDGDGGFGAVANEIKELAAETKEATEDMEDSIDRVQTQADEAVETVTTTGDLIEENVEPIRSAVEALDEIAEYAEETNTGVQEISAATEQQAASTQEAVAMVDEAAAIAERTSLASENVAAAAEQQTGAMTEVSNSASELSGQASQLSEKLDRFTTGDTDASLDGAELSANVGDAAGEDVDDGFDAEFGDDLGADIDTDFEDGFEDVDLEPADGGDDDGDGGLGGNDPATFGDDGEDGDGADDES